MTMRSVVVLPAPLGPSSPKTLPRGTSSERSFTATWPAKVFPIPFRTRALSFMEPPGPAAGADGPSARGLERHPKSRTKDGPGGSPRHPCGRFYTLGRAVLPPRRDARNRSRRLQHARLRDTAHPRQGGVRRRREAAAPSRLAVRRRGRPDRPPRARPASSVPGPAEAVGHRLRLRLQLDRLLSRPGADPGLGDRPGPLHLPRDRGPSRRARRASSGSRGAPSSPRSAPSPAARSPRGGRPRTRLCPRPASAWALAAALVYASYVVLSSRFGAGVPGARAGAPPRAGVGGRLRGARPRGRRALPPARPARAPRASPESASSPPSWP